MMKFQIGSFNNCLSLAFSCCRTLDLRGSLKDLTIYFPDWLWIAPSSALIFQSFCCGSTTVFYIHSRYIFSTGSCCYTGIFLKVPAGRGRSFQDPNGPFPTNLPLVLRQRENCMLQVPKFLKNPGKTNSPKRSCQVANVRDCSNCVLVIAGSPEFNPGSQNSSPNLPSEPNWQSQFSTLSRFSEQFWIASRWHATIRNVFGSEGSVTAPDARLKGGQ